MLLYYFKNKNSSLTEPTAKSTNDNFDKELEKGIRIEQEHSDTIKKIYSHEVEIEDAPRLIALDHLNELPDYYTQIEKIEANA